LKQRKIIRVIRGRIFEHVFVLDKLARFLQNSTPDGLKSGRMTFSAGSFALCRPEITNL
jgi:hypothetical protein